MSPNPPQEFVFARGLRRLGLTLLAVVVATNSGHAETVALWLFDEPAWLYPSHVLDSSAGLDAPLVLGLGGTLVEGRWGRALSTRPHPPIVIPETGEETASLPRLPVPAGRNQEPLTWHNAQFCALMTGGERHLRKEVSFVNPTATDLNLGAFDWTVEFWLRLDAAAGSDAEGVVLEIGAGPRGENQLVTRLTFVSDPGRFRWQNAPAGSEAMLVAPRDTWRDGGWHHCAFVHRAAAGSLQLFVDGRAGASVQSKFQSLPHGEEAYLSIGRDGTWGQPLGGELDELRISRGCVYTADFAPPGSFARPTPAVALERTEPLRFTADRSRDGAVPLGRSKHVFWDDALLEPGHGLTFRPHPPKRIERVIENIVGPFRKHLTVIEDDDGLIRLYNPIADDYLGVRTSRDGVHWEIPDTGIHHRGNSNIVIPEPAPLGRPMIDPNGPAEHRWKYVSGYEGRGVYLYTSPDGWKWTRHRTAVLPFRSGSQSSFFYDEQRGLYVGYHRTGFGLSAGGGTRREFVLSEATDPFLPVHLAPLSQAELWEIAKTRPLRSPIPWWLDNGPLTPGDFGIELPTIFAPDDRIDPPGTGIYVPKATKYPWADDAYVAFLAMYFDYEEPMQPATRRTLFDPKRDLGSGVLEAQVAVSRDGVRWQRLPRPAYLVPGAIDGRHLHQIYVAEGLVRRGDEIWQYFYGQEEYHSPHRRNPAGNGVYRIVQRLDGFVSAEAPYEQEVTVRTRPLTFQGRQLELNVDTNATGYLQVGFEYEDRRPVPGFGVDDCVYINANDVHHRVEWLKQGSDVSVLAGQPIRLVMRMRAARLFALQFVN